MILCAFEIQDKFVETADEELKKQLQEIYIGKIQKDDEVNAIANFRNPDYEGYLIQFYFELEYILYNIGEAYSAFKLALFKQDNDDLAIIQEILLGNILALPDQNYDGMLKLHSSRDEHVKKVYGELASNAFMAGTAFVVAHEIGHHILKHTEGPTQANFNIRGGNIYHEYEYCADEFALSLMFKRNEVDKSKEFTYEYLLGPLLTILAIALNDRSPHLSSPKHPSVLDRYKNILNNMKNIIDNEEFEKIIYFYQVFLNLIEKYNNPWDGNKWW